MHSKNKTFWCIFLGLWEKKLSGLIEWIRRHQGREPHHIWDSLISLNKVPGAAPCCPQEVCSPQFCSSCCFCCKQIIYLKLYFRKYEKSVPLSRLECIFLMYINLLFQFKCKDFSWTANVPLNHNCSVKNVLYFCQLSELFVLCELVLTEECGDSQSSTSGRSLCIAWERRADYTNVQQCRQKECYVKIKETVIFKCEGIFLIKAVWPLSLIHKSDLRGFFKLQSHD